MEYGLKTPCENCPFRNDKPPFISVERVTEIIYSNAEFACHKTVDYDDEDHEDGKIHDKSQHCAGLLIILENEGEPHQMMRITARLGLYDPTALDYNAPVYAEIDDCICAHEDYDGER